jgi:hypothetical protein
MQKENDCFITKNIISLMPAKIVRKSFLKLERKKLCMVN